MNALDWAFLLAAIAAIAGAVFALRRGQAGPVRAHPDLEFVLEKLAQERADFRADLEGSTRYHLMHAEQLRADQQAKDKILLGVIEDARSQNAALFSALLASAQRAPLPPELGNMQTEHADVMDDEREAELERLRAMENGAEQLPPGAQGIIEQAMKNIRGVPT